MHPPHPTWLEWVRTFWPVAVVLIPVIMGAGFLWLGTKFASRADVTTQGVEIKRLDTVEIRRLDDRIDGHHTRLSLVENDCGASPTRGEMNQDMAVLAGRMSAVESAVRGFERTLNTQHDIQRTLLEQALRK